jgi:hypothetical protein
LQRRRAHAGYQQVIDDWLKRLAYEQDFRRLYLQRFERGATDPCFSMMDPVAFARVSPQWWMHPASVSSLLI